MVPSNRWFPSSLQERAAWFQNFRTHFEPVYLSLGFNIGDLNEVIADNAMVQYLAETATSVEAFKDASRQFRLIVTEGSIGEPTPVFPAYMGPTEPDPVQPGIFERMIARADRTRIAPAYTAEIGASLQIIPSSSNGGGSNVIADEIKPTLKPVTKPGNVVEVGFTRGQTDGIEVEIRIDNDPSWSDAGRFFKSPAILDIPDGTGLPRAVQIRARFLEGNDAIGQNSDTVNVVTTP